MRSAGTRLSTVGEEPIETILGRTEPVEQSPPRVIDRAIAAGLMLALKTLSQKVIVALATLTDLMMIASAFALWIMIIAAPSVLQLVGVGMYAVFVLLAVFLRGRQ